MGVDVQHPGLFLDMSCFLQGVLRRCSVFLMHAVCTYVSEYPMCPCLEMHGFCGLEALQFVQFQYFLSSSRPNHTVVASFHFLVLSSHASYFIL